MRARRFDFSLSPLAAPIRRPDGTMVVEARISRPCISYWTADGVQQNERDADTACAIYTPASELFSPETLASLRLIPVTFDHPDEVLTADSSSSLRVGATGENIRRDGEWLIAPLTIYDQFTISQMESGEAREVSLGWICEIEDTPGTAPDGERYDMIYRNPVANHLAICQRARLGPDARMRLDAMNRRTPSMKAQRRDIDATDFREYHTDGGVYMGDDHDAPARKDENDMQDDDNGLHYDQAHEDRELAAEQAKTAKAREAMLAANRRAGRLEHEPTPPEDPHGVRAEQMKYARGQ